MKTLTAAAALLFLLTCHSNAKGQVPGIQDLTQTIDQAASQLNEGTTSPFGFKKLQMPKLLDGLLDVRVKKPQLPSLGLLDKLKNIGKPQVNSGEAAVGPILGGLSKLFPTKQKTSPSFLEKMFGSSGQPSQPQLPFGQGDMSDLAEATKGLSDHVGRMSNGVRSSATQLFNGQSVGSGTSGTLQPPLQTARQYSAGQIQSRY